jgi:RNA polymerase sigma factor (sigma-70 family)
MPASELEFIPKVYEEHHLIAGLKHGSDAWLKEFYAISYKAMYWLIRNKGADHAEVEDIIQESIMIVYEKIADNSLVLTSKLTTYTVSVGQNLWLKACRKRGRMVVWDNHLPEITLDDDDYTLEEDRYAEMEKAFKLLDDECQKILRKRYWEKESFKDLSMGLSKTESALKMKSSRCHEQMYTWLINKI